MANHPDVKACVKVIADIVSSTPLHLLENKKAGNVRVNDGLYRRVDINPNRYIARSTLYYKITEELLLHGNSFLLPVFDRDGLLEELRPIPQETASFVPLDDGGYKVLIDKYVVNSADIVHFVNNPSSGSPWQGGGYKVYVSDVLKNLNQSQGIKSKYYKEHFRPSLVFLAQGDADIFNSDEERESFFDRWLKVKPGRPYILPESIIDFKTFTPLSLKEIAVNESVEIDKRYLASLFGVPPFLVGIGDFNKDEYNLFIDRTVKRICGIISQELTRKILIASDRFFKFNIEAQKVVDPFGRLKIMYEGRALGIYNANECRIAAGHEFIDDPEMDKYKLLENYINAEDSGKQKKLEQGGD